MGRLLLAEIGLPHIRVGADCGGLAGSDDPAIDQDRDAVVQHALESGVGMVCVGTDLKTSEQAVTLAERYEGVWASVGLHPNDDLNEQYDEVAYERLAASSGKVIAIGEIGLDYYRTTEKRAFQRERFLKQLDLAKRLTLPVIIHCRDAHEDMAEILKDKEVRGVVHSFTGTAQQAAAYADMGLFVGFNGIVTFTDQYNEAVRTVPLDRLLLETDSPFLSPAPYRGKRNEPVRVLEVAKRVSAIKMVDEETLLKASNSNTYRLFNIPI